MSEMQQIKIYGASDDLVEIEGPGGDELGAYGKRREITITTGGLGVVVGMEYAPKGTSAGVWRADIRQIDEDIDMPPISITMGGRGYTPLVTVTVSEGSVVEFDRETT